MDTLRKRKPERSASLRSAINRYCSFGLNSNWSFSILGKCIFGIQFNLELHFNYPVDNVIDDIESCRYNYLTWQNMQSISAKKIIGFLLLFPFLIDVFLLIISERGGVYYCYDCIGQSLFAVIIGLPLFAVGLYLLIPHGEGNYFISGLKFLGKLLAVLAILCALYILFGVYGGDFLYNTFGINL